MCVDSHQWFWAGKLVKSWAARIKVSVIKGVTINESQNYPQESLSLCLSLCLSLEGCLSASENLLCSDRMKCWLFRVEKRAGLSHFTKW